MNSRLRTIMILSVGTVLGASLSIGSSVLADRTTEKSAVAALPLEDLRTFSEAFGRVKADYVEPVEDKKLLENGALRETLAACRHHEIEHRSDALARLHERLGPFARAWAAVVGKGSEPAVAASRRL